jgi:hypothetical protein
LTGLLALVVFAFFAGPGLCAIACEIGACTGCQTEPVAASCCQAEKAKPKPCCEQMAKVTSADGEKSVRAPFVLPDIQALVPAPVLPDGPERTSARQSAALSRERAPPGPSLDPHLARGPPSVCV